MQQTVKQIESLEELSAFSGQIILELQNYKTNSHVGEITEEIIKIQTILFNFCHNLYNNSVFEEKTFEFVNCLISKYESYLGNEDSLLYTPLGSAYICNAVCKRISENFCNENIENKNIDECLVTNIYIFLLKLSKYFLKVGSFINLKIRNMYFKFLLF